MSRPRKSTRAAQGSGTLRERKDGTWEGRYTVGRDPATGKQTQKSVYGKNQDEARRKLSQAIAAVDNGTYTESSRITVEQWLNEYMRDYTGGLKAGTVSKYIKDISRYILPHIGRVPVKNLKSGDVQRMMNTLKRGTKTQAPLSGKSVRNVISVLRSALVKAVKLGMLQANPIDACTLPRVEEYKQHPIVDDDRARFFEAIRGHKYERLFLLDFYTGMRKSELLGLTWDCVNFQNSAIRVYRQFQYVKSENRYEFTSTKTDRERTIAVPAAVMDILRRQRQWQNEMRLQGIGFNNPDNFIFTNELGEHLSHSTVYHSFKVIVALIGLPKTRFHDIRHSYATLAFELGDDLATASDNLGHSQHSTTANIYGHSSTLMKRKSAERLQAFIESV